MSDPSRLRPRVFAGAVLSILCVLPVGLTAGQSAIKRVFGGDRSTDYKIYKDSAGRFELEYPTKDWKLLPSGGSSLAVFARNDGPTLFVDYVRLIDRLTPGELDALPEGELDRLKGQQPKSTDFKSEMLESKAGRGVLIRYSRTGNAPETVAQFTVVVGPDLFRINGVIPEKQAAKYDAVITHMIQSFKAPAEAPAAKPNP
jgi:hypothetical protein